MTPTPECSYFVDIILDTGQPSAETQAKRLIEAIQSEPELDENRLGMRGLIGNRDTTN